MQADPPNLRYLTDEVQRMKAASDKQTFDGGSGREYDQIMPELTRQQVTDLLAASEAKVDSRLANFDTSIKTGFAEMRAEFSGLRADFSKIQADMSKGTTETIKWAIALAISVVIMTVGLLTFINKTADKPAPAAAQPAPIIITVPAAAVPSVATPPAAQK